MEEIGDWARHSHSLPKTWQTPEYEAYEVGWALVTFIRWLEPRYSTVQWETLFLHFPKCQLR